MEEKEPVSFTLRVQEFVKKNLLFVFLVVIGVLLLGIGIFQYFKSQESGIEFVSSSPAGSDPAGAVKVLQVQKSQLISREVCKNREFTISLKAQE